MKKAIAILLVLLVAGVAFSAVVGIDTDTTLTLEASNALKTEFTVTESAGASGIDLSLANAENFNNIEVGAWSLFSNSAAGNLRIELYTDGGFTSTEITDVTGYSIPYTVVVNNTGNNASDSGLSSAVIETAPLEIGLLRAGNGAGGAFLAATNNGSVTVSRADTETEYLAATNYVSTITLLVTAQ